MTEVRARFKAALEAADVDRVRELLATHDELAIALHEPMFSFGRQPLVYASALERRDLMEVLLEAGANIDATSDWPAGPFSALHHQIASTTPPKPELAGFLIDRGATIDLHSAAGLGRIDVLTQYLDADPSRVNEPGPDGATPLHLALNVKTAAWLLERGADIEQRCVDHNSTAAMWAIDERLDVLRFLIERGAPPDLFMAAVLNDPMMVKRVLAEDPDAIRCRTREGPFAHPPEGGDIYIWKLDFVETPHEVARLRANQQVYRYLMERSPNDIKLVQVAREGDLPAMRELLTLDRRLLERMPAQLRFHLMCQAPAAVAVALEFGADPNVRSRDGATPLHQAAWDGDLERTRFLVDNAADATLRDPVHSSTPLGWAMYGGKQSVVDYLAENTAVDLIDSIVLGRTEQVLSMLDDDPAAAHGAPGATPLRAAAYVGDLAVVTKLLALGVDPTPANPNTGLTATDLARERGHAAVVVALERA